jgi:ribosomal protein S17E
MLTTEDKKNILVDEFQVFLHSIDFLRESRGLGYLGQASKDIINQSINLIEIEYPVLFDYNRYIHKKFTKELISEIQGKIAGYMTDVLNSFYMNFEAEYHTKIAQKDIVNSSKRLARDLPKFIHRLEREL